MTNIDGFFYQSGSAQRDRATLHLNHSGYSIVVDGATISNGENASLKFSSRLGNIPRRVALPDGSAFESEDNAGIDTALQELNHPDARSSALHRLESKWRWVIIGVIVTAGFLFSVINWGIPAASKAIANNLPVEINQKLATGTLATLDELLLAPSELPSTKQQEFTERFAKLLSQLDHSPYVYQLHFRQMQDTPNAFALPNGDIVVTDALITSASRPEEVEAVLLHEIGHVEHRHSLRQVIASSIIAIGSAYITGGSTVGDELFVGLPVFLLQQSYSRESESEADEFAFEQMLELEIDPIHFATIMEKMTGASDRENSEQPIEGRLTYISSHPLSVERIALARTYSKRFNAAR